jgi:hypothetical protein
MAVPVAHGVKPFGNVLREALGISLSLHGKPEEGGKHISSEA